MGGAAFTIGDTPLNTPRMPRDIYETVNKNCQVLLKERFIHVETPIDGPAKEDFGDVDILVCEPREAKQLEDAAWVAEVARILGTDKSVYTKGNGAAGNFAVRWPGPDAGDKWVQVDVRVCSSLQEMHWILFRHAHGDMWNVVGSMIRPYGLSVDEQALWLRVPEIEYINKTRAKVKLTEDSSRVLEFIGIDEKKYWAGTFATLDEMYELAASCRFMYTPPIELDDEGNEIQPWSNNSLKSNDRRRAKMRKGFRLWVEEFIPKCREQGRFATKPTTKEETIERALTAFGVREEFERVRNEFLVEQQHDVIFKELIKGSVPPVEDPQDSAAILKRSCLVKALKATILLGSDEYGCVFDKSAIDKDGLYDLDEVKLFIKAKCDVIGNAALKRHNDAYKERMIAKEASNAAKDAGQA